MAVRTRTIHESSVQGGDAKIEEYLDKKGVQWVFHPRVEPDQFDAQKSLQNQARISAKGPIDDSRVEMYAEAMKRGDEFPPVIAHGKAGKLVIADGNHRLQAATKAKKPIGMYHITGDARTIVLITFEANTRHGLPTSEDERVQHALYLLDNGAKIPEAAAALSLPRRVLEKASLARQADQRFLESGLPLMMIERIPSSIKTRLKDVSTDEGFIEAVKLVVDAHLGANEVFPLVTDINERRSSSKQVEYIQGLRKDVYAERIGQTGGGTFTKSRTMGPKARVGLALSNLEGLPEDFAEVAKAWVGPEREEAAERMRKTAKRLTDMAKVLTA